MCQLIWVTCYIDMCGSNKVWSYNKMTILQGKQTVQRNHVKLTGNPTVKLWRGNKGTTVVLQEQWPSSPPDLKPKLKSTVTTMSRHSTDIISPNEHLFTMERCSLSVTGQYLKLLINELWTDCSGSVLSDLHTNVCTVLHKDSRYIGSEHVLSKITIFIFSLIWSRDNAVYIHVSTSLHRI